MIGRNDRWKEINRGNEIWQWREGKRSFESKEVGENLVLKWRERPLLRATVWLIVSLITRGSSSRGNIYFICGKRGTMMRHVDGESERLKKFRGDKERKITIRFNPGEWEAVGSSWMTTGKLLFSVSFFRDGALTPLNFQIVVSNPIET